MRSGISTAIFLVVASVMLALSWATSAAADGEVKISRSIPFAADAKVRQAVKDECMLETRIPEYIDEFSDQVELVDGATGRSGRVLEVNITGVRAKGGGIYSGTKWITLSGVLRENGRKIGDFTARRATIGYFQFSACGAARHCAKTLGKDIAAWLENPATNSTLGAD